ncbi:sensor histidine kinase [Flavipsychrobacter stenotrophus]|uniref:sensor histidine kinase n=1 Tax=Flavipsychrobacter stenotrophus TaxID=2077091 RepID=UPI0013752D61|nr:histidine kinase [Flavipsychrobacter stenotrophus]
MSLAKYGIKEDIQFIHNNGNADSNIYVLTANHILLFSTLSNFSKVLIDNYRHFTTDSTLDGNEIRSIYNNSMWGTIFATTSRGLAIRSALKNYFKPEPTIKLQGFNYVQGVPDEKCYWWNVSTSTLGEVDKNYSIKYSKLKNTSVINAIHPYRRDTLLIVGHNNFYMSKSSKKASVVPLTCMSVGIFSWTRTPDNKFIYSCNGGFNIATPVTHDTSNVFILDNIRLPGLVADAKGEEYWAYNNLHIDIYNNKTHQLTKYTREKLIAAGIQKVEKICIDSFNNVYILDNSQLLLFNNRHAKVLKQVSNINIKNCDIHIYKNKLIITGKIGIICLDIYGKDSLSEPVIFPNSNNYYYIYNTQIAFNKILLSTDKGFMSVDISDTGYKFAYNLKKVIDNYRFVCKYGNAAQNINYGDTLILDQEDLKLQFDIINPNGKGSVVYFTQLENNLPTQLTTNELGLPTLKPDRYYALTVNATDEIWKSNNKLIILYVKPYWYQTKIMMRLIWAGIFILLLLLIAVIILVTRKLVLNASHKKSIRMEMELKAIYSQINPHFIFNSLNSALLLISKNKMEDAYTHVSKFSRLLRSYIKSSRNKFIPVQSEILNLRNYIELQQVRFKEKFTYEINDNEIAGRSELVIPSLLLQPFVENAIEHGLLNKQGVGHLRIDFSMANDATLVCSIDDDGIGRLESRKISQLNISKEESYGDLLIKDLVAIFNKYENVHVDIKYEDKISPLTGTLVTITIRYLKTAQ